MSVSILSKEALVGFGKRKQTNISTANIVGDVWRLNKLDGNILSEVLVTEDDAAEYGKGHEFATAMYPSHSTVGPQTYEKYVSSEIIAWASAFCLGTVTPTSGTYTCVPLDKTTGLELPYFSFIQQVRGSTYIDKLFVGCVLESFYVDISNVPGRQSAKITLEILGGGKVTIPSAITLPAKTTEHELKRIGLAFTALSRDYVTNLDFVSLRWGWKNNCKPVYIGGAMQDTNYEIASKIEVGDRMPTLEVVVREWPSSTERAAMAAGTTGTAVLTQGTGGVEDYTVTFPQVAWKEVTYQDDDGKVAKKLVASPQYHSTNGVISVVAHTAVTNICAAPV